MKTYFITGATGAIGAALVPLLLKEKESFLYLLIRAKNQDNLAERLETLYNFWEISLTDERRTRIVPVSGDITHLDFGMDTQVYKKLSETCTHIIHCAGNVRMNLPIAEARACSVSSANNVIDLARICMEKKNLEKVEFVSTVGVGGKLQGVLPETWVTRERTFHNTYEQAKAEAEDVIRSYVDKGFPITVHRPSMVVGDAATGKIIHFQIFYHLCEFLSGKRTLGVTPDTGRTRLDIIPSDYVAQVIAWSSSTRATAGKILHECSGPDNAILISDLKKQVQQIFAEHGEKIPRPVTIPVWMFKTMLPVIGLVVSPKARRSMKALPVFFDYLATNQGFGNENTIEKLKTEKICLPEIEWYLKKIINFYLPN